MKAFSELSELEQSGFYRILNNIVCSTLICGDAYSANNGIYHVLCGLCPDGVWTSTVARSPGMAYLQLLNDHHKQCYTYEWRVAADGSTYVCGDLDAYNDVVQVTPILREAAAQAVNRIEAKI